jgi:predicted RNA-binding protein associated with RNAse of E/G family
LSLSVKDISRSHWPRIIDRSAAYMTVNDGDFTGEIGLLRLNRVKAPLEKTYVDRTVRIVDDGYYWLQLAAPDVPYWLTAMYDDKGRFIQFYFDISDRNVILPDGKAYFIDLLLDVVMAADGGVYLLDEDELSDALAKGEITQAQYDGAHEAARGIVAMLERDKDALIAVCRKYFDLLKDTLA